MPHPPLTASPAAGPYRVGPDRPPSRRFAFRLRPFDGLEVLPLAMGPYVMLVVGLVAAYDGQWKLAAAAAGLLSVALLPATVLAVLVRKATLFIDVKPDRIVVSRWLVKDRVVPIRELAPRELPPGKVRLDREGNVEILSRHIGSPAEVSAFLDELRALTGTTADRFDTERA